MTEDDTTKPKSKLDELIELSRELSEYTGYVADVVNGLSLSDQNQKRASQLLRIIGIKSGSFGKLINELTSEPQDTWNSTLSIPVDKVTWQGAGVCYRMVNKAIGQLMDDVKSGKRDIKTGNILNSAANRLTSIEPPKAFIAHGGKSGVLDKLCEFVEALGIKPIIVELSPTRGLSVDDKVNKYVKDADFGIVLATRGGIVDEKNKRQHPRLNVIDELERLRAAFPEKTILLLEKGVDLPSNVSGLTYEPFARQSMDRAFTAITRELTEFGILKAIKPQEGQEGV
ncbi:TIR domain-containing protein [Chloroflexota bacterium]